MPLNKQPVAFNFRKGLDTKTDPFQVPVGNFLTLVNSVFNTSGRLTKRFGFTEIGSLPDTQATTLTTFNGDLIATGSHLFAFDDTTGTMIDQGVVQPVHLDTLPMVRSSLSQSNIDSATTQEGLVCVVYQEDSAYYYDIADSVTGQKVVQRTALPIGCTDPRAFVVGVYIVVMYKITITGTPNIAYIAIPKADPNHPLAQRAFISSLNNTSTSGWDGKIFENTLYVAWEGNGTTVQTAFLSNLLSPSATTSVAGQSAALVSVAIDEDMQRVWATWWNGSTHNGFAAAFTLSLVQVVAATQLITAKIITQLTSSAVSNFNWAFYQVTNTYSYGTTPRTDFINSVSVTPPVSGTGAGTVSSTTTILRSVGLGSKSFVGPNNLIFMLAEYGDKNQSTAADDTNQPSLFLIDQNGNIYMRLAYSNASGYITNKVLPSVTQVDDQFQVAYLLADLLVPVNKTTAVVAAGQVINSIYTQLGVNLAKFVIENTGQLSSEIAGSLHLTGGQLWQYDGVKPVEDGFQVWPENVQLETTTAMGGTIQDGTYYYVFTYEWTDGAGQLQRSAPSIPLLVTVAEGTNDSTNVINVPTLRLTYKTAPNSVRIVGYRWSAVQQTYYQFTDILTPYINDPTVDSIQVTDTKRDIEILGQTLLYTTGGVVENIAPPASIASALFKNRLFLIDAEDQNLLWFSKQVIENTPVEMSDLLTIFVAPTTGTQGSTGPMTALAAMDDKLIIFKSNAIYYITGNGPDNTGANNDFSDPVFITSSVGCDDPASIVLMPNGLMFQSNKGIWLLGRDLNTTYIGANVESFNANPVMSANSIPGTTQVRFPLDNSNTLMYDYYYNEWAVHTNIKSISATVYKGKDTYLNSLGQILQEDPNSYTDDSVPVLMSLTTPWMNVAGLQGFERFYFGFLLGTYFSPFKLNISLAYDYNPSASQVITVEPKDYDPPWGDQPVWGAGQKLGNPTANVFSKRIFPDRQKCESFQMVIQEQYDSTLGQAPGQGLSLSGIQAIIGIKKGYRTQRASGSFG